MGALVLCANMHRGNLCELVPVVLLLHPVCTHRRPYDLTIRMDSALAVVAAALTPEARRVLENFLETHGPCAGVLAVTLLSFFSASPPRCLPLLPFWHSDARMAESTRRARLRYTDC